MKEKEYKPYYGKCQNCGKYTEIYRNGLCLKCYKKLRKPPFIIID